MGQHPWVLKQGGSPGRWDAALGAGPPEQSLPTPPPLLWLVWGGDRSPADTKSQAQGVSGRVGW